MAGVESSLLSGIRTPCLAAVQQCADDKGVVDSFFVFTVSLGFIHTRFTRRTRVVAAFSILLSSSVSKDRLSVIVELMYVK